MGCERARSGLVRESFLFLLTACSLWILTGCGRSGETDESEAKAAAEAPQAELESLLVPPPVTVEIPAPEADAPDAAPEVDEADAAPEVDEADAAPEVDEADAADATDDADAAADADDAEPLPEPPPPADVEEPQADAAPEAPIAARLAEPIAPVPPRPPRPVIEPLPPPPPPLSAQERRERLDALNGRIAVIGERSQTLRRDLDAARKDNPEGDFSEREAAIAKLRREAIPLIYERASLARALEEEEADNADHAEPEADAGPNLNP